MRILLLGFGLAGSWLATGAMAAIRVDGPRVVIRVENAEAVPVRVLSYAEAIISNMIARAGVTADWISCTPRTPCGTELAPGEFWLHILTRKPRHLAPGALGYSVISPTWDGAQSGSERYAGVFYPEVLRLAEILDADLGDVLGATMAHEIGHLLLGAHAHTAAGVMSPHLDRALVKLVRRGELRFTDEQAPRMRSEAARKAVPTLHADELP